MAQIITAPSAENPIYTSVFLAGGITNCKEWQEQVMDELEIYDISVFNPRREFFDISDRSAAEKQIAWEYEQLERMDIFSMYFCDDNSDQPICMYELGRNIVRMQNRFPSDWQKRIVVSVEYGYRRRRDVLVQLRLCAQDIFVDVHATPRSHAFRIKKAFHSI
jgi:hypothetical protein